MAKALALARQSHVALGFRTRRALLLLAMREFFAAQPSPLFVPTLTSRFSPLCPMFFLRWISSSRFLVSALKCCVASLSALEISLVSEWTWPVSRFDRIDRGVFLHSSAHEGDPRLMRQMRAQLRAKCESAPLRRSVTERAMRSTLTALIC